MLVEVLEDVKDEGNAIEVDENLMHKLFTRASDGILTVRGGNYASNMSSKGGYKYYQYFLCNIYHKIIMSPPNNCL